MPSNYNCPYGRTCQDYDHDSITCSLLYGFCRIRKHIEKMETSALAEHLIALSGQNKREKIRGLESNE